MNRKDQEYDLFDQDPGVEGFLRDRYTQMLDRVLKRGFKNFDILSEVHVLAASQLEQLQQMTTQTEENITTYLAQCETEILQIMNKPNKSPGKLQKIISGLRGIFR